MLGCIRCAHFYEGTCTYSGQDVTPDSPQTCDKFCGEEEPHCRSKGELLALHRRSVHIKTVPTGRWVYGVLNGTAQWYCSNCENEAYWDTDYGQQLFDFCQCCGAEMKNTEGVP